ncbi:hypothetical protein AS594_09915 [Streptomyces agglomeratus]|uniref:Uncharacterized protein n=1 Tax=Streptomyces agglomeratus TaxID=285458 RepID=A0A1E5PIL7_9ACTN|nr:hypothetical protein AS594_09915 [Streptomyces agglomeratus]OEJ53783.1 hypothetical protein BGK72_26290 [Streptomyces agglomeratus]
MPSRVQQANCRWAGLEGQPTVPGSPFRTVDSTIEAQDELDAWANGHDSDANYTTYTYRCDECGLQSDISAAGAPHPVNDVVMDSGFGFDSQRKLFVASDAPGTLVILIASEHLDPLSLLLPSWRKPLPRASFAYAEKYGLMAGRHPIHEGQFPVDGGSEQSGRYNYALLRAT